MFRVRVKGQYRNQQRVRETIEAVTNVQNEMLEQNESKQRANANADRHNDHISYDAI